MQARIEPASTSSPTGWLDVKARMRAAADIARRAPATIELVAVSKGQPASALRALAAHGQRAFGENYLQEALEKMSALADLDLSWHFIGRLQANKTREVAARFDWCHSVDRLKVAERLNAHRPPALPPLACCIEVNLSGEASKAGVDYGALDELVAAFAGLPRLTLRGFMSLPAPDANPAAQRAAFGRLRALLARFPKLDTLSMGTSDDFEAAIAEGATLVRVGAAVFGPRASPAGGSGR